MTLAVKSEAGGKPPAQDAKKTRAQKLSPNPGQSRGCSRLTPTDPRADQAAARVMMKNRRNRKEKEMNEKMNE